MKTYFNWSSGKDAALALYHLQQKLTVDRLLTTINAHHDRVSMHGLRTTLLMQQVKNIGLPLTTLMLSEQPSMEEYDQKMAETIAQLKAEGYTDCGFGDIFLEDLRAYREKQLEGITCHFPLWRRNTQSLIEEFITLGFKAIIICLDASLLDASWLGREIDESFIQALPAHVDPCGENGEFHTFCFDGPIFSKPVAFEKGEKVLRQYKKPKNDAQEPEEKQGFWFIDLLPV
ncbi:MAG: diphthine--ammonia ligase [Thermonemataceae bacterium]